MASHPPIYILNKPNSEDLEKERVIKQFQAQHPELDFNDLINKAAAASSTAPHEPSSQSDAPSD
jgi:hypothetical protein